MVVNLLNDDSYESAAIEWQYQMILILKEALKKNGVNTIKSKDICGEFAFDLALLQDQGEIIIDSESLRPVICFENLKGTLRYNSVKQCQIHEYAFGNASEAFGE